MPDQADQPITGQRAVDRAVEFFREANELRADESQPMLAEPWERVLARGVDICIVLAIFYVLTSLYLYPGAVRPPSNPESSAFPEPELSWAPPPADTPTVIVQVVFVVGLFAAYELGTAALLRVTPGKRLLQLQVRRDSGVPAGWKALAIRTFAWTPLAGAAVLLFGTTPSALLFAVPIFAAALMLFRSPDRRTWYDRVAGTVVVKPR